MMDRKFRKKIGNFYKKFSQELKNNLIPRRKKNSYKKRISAKNLKKFRVDADSINNQNNFLKNFWTQRIGNSQNLPNSWYFILNRPKKSLKNS